MSGRSMNKRITQSFLGWTVVMIAALVLLGNLLNVSFLKAPFDALLHRPPSTIGPAPTTTIMFILLGIAVILMNSRTK